MFCAFISLYLWHLVDGVNIVSMTEGDSVTLHTDDAVGYKDYVQWTFGPQSTVIIIQFNGGTPDIVYFNDKEIRDRLQIDNQTGSLTIRNVQTTDTGLYELLMLKYRLLFNVTVYASLYIWRWNIRIKTPTVVCSTIPTATRPNILTSANSVRHVQTTSTVAVSLKL